MSPRSKPKSTTRPLHGTASPNCFKLASRATPTRTDELRMFDFGEMMRSNSMQPPRRMAATL
eukprot:2095094-Pyramimonas_sp.AAC.1